MTLCTRTYIAYRCLHKSLMSQLIKEQSWRINFVAQINIWCGLTFLFECVAFILPQSRRSLLHLKSDFWILVGFGEWSIIIFKISEERPSLCKREDSPIAQERRWKLGQKADSFLMNWKQTGWESRNWNDNQGTQFPFIKGQSETKAVQEGKGTHSIIPDIPADTQSVWNGFNSTTCSNFSVPWCIFTLGLRDKTQLMLLHGRSAQRFPPRVPNLLIQNFCGGVLWGQEQRELPMCRLVSSTAAFLLTLDSKPRQKRSELEGSVKPSTVMEGCEAWKVSPTLWLSS